jgi:hypothetical protein
MKTIKKTEIQVVISDSLLRMSGQIDYQVFITKIKMIANLFF